jgi:hypothetical protein
MRTLSVTGLQPQLNSWQNCKISKPNARVPGRSRDVLLVNPKGREPQRKGQTASHRLQAHWDIPLTARRSHGCCWCWPAVVCREECAGQGVGAVAAPRRPAMPWIGVAPPSARGWKKCPVALLCFP